MEVKIGIQHAPREVVFESEIEPDELAAIITEAWSANKVVELEDSKGSKILVPTDKISFVELGPSSRRRVGFGG